MSIHSTPILDDKHCEVCGERLRGECPDHAQICAKCSDAHDDFPTFDDFD